MMKIEKATKPKADKAITTRLNADDFARLEQIARRSDVTARWLARRILERAIVDGIEIATA